MNVIITLVSGDIDECFLYQSEENAWGKYLEIATSWRLPVPSNETMGGYSTDNLQAVANIIDKQELSGKDLKFLEVQIEDEKERIVSIDNGFITALHTFLYENFQEDVQPLDANDVMALLMLPVGEEHTIYGAVGVTTIIKRLV